MPYVLYAESVWQFHCADSLDLLQLLAACLNIFILSGFVRDEPGLIRSNNVGGVVIDMLGQSTRFDYFFSEVALTSCITRNQFNDIRITRVRTACAGVRFATVGALRLGLLPIMLPILLLLRLPIRLPIKLLIGLLGMLLIRQLAISILFIRIRGIVAWLGCLLYCEIFGCHLKGLVGGIH